MTASTVSVGQHLSTPYPVVTVTLVVDATQECGGHSADYAETSLLGHCSVLHATADDRLDSHQSHRAENGGSATDAIPLLPCLQIPYSSSGAEHDA